jgi:hypothetical protein
MGTAAERKEFLLPGGMPAGGASRVLLSRILLSSNILRIAFTSTPWAAIICPCSMSIIPLNGVGIDEVALLGDVAVLDIACQLLSDIGGTSVAVLVFGDSETASKPLSAEAGVKFERGLDGQVNPGADGMGGLFVRRGRGLVHTMRLLAAGE